MAEFKTLNTRLKLKIDTLENWNKSSLTLLPGEVALATVAASAGTGLEEPVVMMKVATEEGKTFSQLPWAFHSKSSDVLAACKTAEGLTAFVNSVIANAGIASDEAMEELAGKVTTAEGKITTLEGKMTAVEGKASANETAIGVLKGDASTAGSVAKSIADAIAALKLDETYAAKSHKHEMADVNGLSDALAGKEAAGEAAKVQTALNEYKTSNDAAVLANKNSAAANAEAIGKIKDGTTIDSFKDVEEALAGKQATGDYATKSEAQGYANAKDSAIAEAKKAGTDAAAALEAYKTSNNEALAGVKATADAAAVKTEVEAELAKKVDKVEGKSLIDDTEIARLAAMSDGANKVEASETNGNIKIDGVETVVYTHPQKHAMSEIDGLAAEFAKYQVAGDYAEEEHTHEIGEVNGLSDAIADAKKAGTDAAAAAKQAQDEVDALETYVGTIPETAEATNIVAYIQEKTAGIATDAALDELTGRVAGAEGAIDAIEADYLKASDKTELQGNIDALAGKVGNVPEGETIVGMIADAQEAATYDDTQVKADIKANADAIDAIEKDYLKAADKEALQGQITANANAITLLTDGVDADKVDGVKDLIDYVEKHGAEVTGMKDDIKANSEAIAAEAERAAGVEGGLNTRLEAVEAAIGETGSVATAIEEAIADANEYADGLNTAMNTRVEALEAIDHSHDNMAVLNGITSDKVTAWDGSLAAAKKYTRDYVDPIDKAWNNLRTQDVGRISVLEKASHTHANKDELDKFVDGDKAKLDSAVQSVTAAADSGLKATRTGNDIAIEIDDSITFVFDCGNSEM